MRKATIDIDAMRTIRRSPEATAGTLATYSALREIATEAGSCDFNTRVKDIKTRSLLGDTGTRRALDLMHRRRLIDRRPAAGGIRVRMLKVADY